MSLYNKLTQTGTVFSPTKTGLTPPTNVLATKSSPLHASSNQPGWSLIGYYYTSVKTGWDKYDDGVDNVLPRPTKLLRKDFLNIPQYINNTPG